MLEWAAATWPEQSPRSLGALAARVERGTGEIRELETVLYSANIHTWSGQPLWEAFKNGLLQSGKRAGSATQRTDGAPALYPDWQKQAS